MATILTPTHTDDLAEVAEGESAPKLNPNQRVRIALTDGDSVWLVDTKRSNEMVSILKGAGVKQAKRGRKAGSDTEPSEAQDEAQEGEAQDN